LGTKACCDSVWTFESFAVLDLSRRGGKQGAGVELLLNGLPAIAFAVQHIGIQKILGDTLAIIFHWLAKTADMLDGASGVIHSDHIQFGRLLERGETGNGDNGSESNDAGCNGYLPGAFPAVDELTQM